jgi:NADPH:quinone reductase-like Zn-dependent oxidoreductase
MRSTRMTTATARRSWAIGRMCTCLRLTAQRLNAAPGQAATTLKAVADGGRLATITGDPPREERDVAVSDVYVRPDGRQLSALAELLANGTLSVPIASVRPLEQAAQALREVVAGADGAIVLSLRT